MPVFAIPHYLLNMVSLSARPVCHLFSFCPVEDSFRRQKKNLSCGNASWKLLSGGAVSSTCQEAEL